jgi:uncharacterized protein (DUF58 family)
MSNLCSHSLCFRNRIGARLRALATYEVLPEFSARVRRFVYNPPGVLALTGLAGLLCGIFLHPQGLVLFGGVLGVALLGIFWPWLSLRGVHGTISFAQSRATEGDQVEMCLTLRNRLPWSAWGLAVRDGFSKRSAGTDAASPVASIASAPRRRTIRCRWSFVPLCRGV